MEQENSQENQENSPSFKSSFKQSLWEFIKFFAIAALIVVPIRIWIAQPFLVSGTSMVPNFQNGEYLIVDELSYQFRSPQRGEVIIFRYPQDTSKYFIKRIIGLPGERIEIKNNQLYVYNEQFPQGKLIEESYRKNENLQMAATSITLNSDQYFVLGDNRDLSLDSRYWGPLNRGLIIGQAFLRLWPFEKLAFRP